MQTSVITLSNNANVNYVAKIVKINNITKVENSDNLYITSICGVDVIVNSNVKQNDIMVYFPVECQIDHKILSKNNLYRDATRNHDIEKKGFFEDNGRVKCVKLRGIYSEGFLMPISDVLVGEFEVGTIFNTLDGDVVVRKYKVEHTHEKKVKTRKSKLTPEVDPEYFKAHYDTSKLNDNLASFRDNPICYITEKLHGTSGISAYLPMTEPDTLFNKILNYVGVSRAKKYGYIVSSRRVVRDENDGSVWAHAHNVIKPLLTKGMTIYYEIVGYEPDGKMIQSKYDYGTHAPGNTGYLVGEHYDIYVYRITTINEDGIILDWDLSMVMDYVKKHNIHGVSFVPLIFITSLIDFSSTGEIDESVIKGLREKYVHGRCPYCTNKVPREGIVVRPLGYNTKAYKFKSPEFLKMETEELDKGVSDTESEA